MRQDISRLRRNRALHFQIGLCISLLASIFTLNFTVYPDEVPPLTYEIESDILDFEVLRTAHPKPAPPPPPKPSLENIVVSDDIPEIEPPKLTLETEPIEIPTNTDVKFKASPTPVVPPPPPPLPEMNVPEVWKKVEQMPRFGDCVGLQSENEYKACTDKNILEYIYGEIKYPSIARENGVEGTVVVNFVIDENGKITKPKILREIGAGCGDEVMRVIKDMPDWVPGEQRKKKVKVQFNIPVKFQLD